MKRKNIFKFLSLPLISTTMTIPIVSCSKTINQNNDLNKSSEYTWQKQFNTFANKNNYEIKDKQFYDLLSIFNNNKKINNDVKKEISKLLFLNDSLVLDIIIDVHTIWIIFDPLLVNLKKQEYFINNQNYYFQTNYNFLQIIFDFNYKDIYSYEQYPFNYKFSFNRTALWTFCVYKKIRNLEQLHEEIQSNKKYVLFFLNCYSLFIGNTNPVEDIYMIDNYVVIKQKESIDYEIPIIFLDYYQYKNYSFFEPFFIDKLFSKPEYSNFIDINENTISSFVDKLIDYKNNNSKPVFKQMIQNNLLSISQLLNVELSSFEINNVNEDIQLIFKTNDSYPMKTKTIEKQDFIIEIEYWQIKITFNNSFGVENVKWINFHNVTEKFLTFIYSLKPWELSNEENIKEFIKNLFKVKSNDIINLFIIPNNNDDLLISFVLKNNWISDISRSNSSNVTQSNLGTKLDIIIKNYKGLKFDKNPSLLNESKINLINNNLYEMQWLSNPNDYQNEFKNNIVKLIKNTLLLNDDDIGLLFKYKNEYYLKINCYTKNQNGYYIKFKPIPLDKLKRVDVDVTYMYKNIIRVFENSNDIGYIQLWMQDYLTKKLNSYMNKGNELVYLKTYKSITNENILMIWNPLFKLRYFPVNEHKNVQFTNPEFMFIKSN